MCWRSSPPIGRPISPAWPGISAAAKPRWPARRKWMPSPPACSAPFPLQLPSGAAAGGRPAAV
jgi:hypothetical protein